MKKLLLTLFCLALFLSPSFSQKVYSEYNSIYFNSKYNLEVSFDEEDQSKYDIWINATSIDDLVEKTGIKVNSNKIDLFVKSLNLIKEKYIEWTTVAKTNNVEELKKDFNIDIPTVDGFFYFGDEWEFDYSVKPTARFIILKNKKGELCYVLLISSGGLTSSSNEYIKSDGLYIALSSIKEIEDFISGVSPETILSFKNKPKTEDLFK